MKTKISIIFTSTLRKFDFSMLLLVLFIAFLYTSGTYLLAYISGYYQIIDWLGGILFMLCPLTLSILCFIQVLRCICLFFYKQQLRSVSISVIILALIFFISSTAKMSRQPSYLPITQGVYESMKKKADIDSINHWLINNDALLPGSYELDRNLWSEELEKLAPTHIYATVNDNNRYIRLFWGGPFGHYGMIVGVNIDDILLNDYFSNEYRIPLEKNAFVWHELKR